LSITIIINDDADQLMMAPDYDERH